jgi:ribonuclease T2
MQQLVVLLLVSLCLVFSFTPSEQEGYDEVLGDTANNDWDYILYTTRWPAAVAQGPVPSNITGFTLHGLWPNRNDTTWPSYCTSQSFSLKPIESLVPTLVEIWYDFEHPYDPSDFWSHEYDKHGTCASSDPLLATEYQFFSAAIKLHQTVFPLTSILSGAGIVPSSSQQYSLSAFRKAIQSGLGAYPMMTCSQDYDGNVQVERIQFCVSKSLQLYNCDSAIINKIDSSGNCGTGNISFPPIPRSGDF